MKAYSQDLRDRVIEKFKTGEYEKKTLSLLFNIGRHTISRWVKMYETTGDYSSKQHIQIGREARIKDKNSILEYLAGHPNAGGKQIRNFLDPKLPMSTLYDTMSRMKITYKKKSLNTSKEKRWTELSLKKKYLAYHQAN